MNAFFSGGNWRERRLAKAVSSWREDNSGSRESRMLRNKMQMRQNNKRNNLENSFERRDYQPYMKVRGSKSRSSGSVSLLVKAEFGVCTCSSSAIQGWKWGKTKFHPVFMLLRCSTLNSPFQLFSMVILVKERIQKHIDLIDLNPR